MELTGAKPPDAADKARLLTFDQLDGRTMAAKNARALIDNLQSDLGGAERLSAAEREIVRRAALASAILEHMESLWLMGKGIDAANYCTLVNAQRRLLTTLGLQRRPRDVTPDLQSYIASQAGQGDAHEAGDGE